MTDNKPYPDLPMQVACAGVFPVYSADQMRAYVDADRAMRAADELKPYPDSWGEATNLARNFLDGFPSTKPLSTKGQQLLAKAIMDMDATCAMRAEQPAVAQAAPAAVEGPTWEAIRKVQMQYLGITKAAVALVAAVDEQHNKEVPLKYAVPYGAVNDLREALTTTPTTQAPAVAGPSEPVGSIYRNSVTGEFELLDYSGENHPMGTHVDIFATPTTQAAPQPAASGLARQFTDGTRTLRQDCISAVRDFSNSSPEDGESWESWFEAAFDLLKSRLESIFDEHATQPQEAAPSQDAKRPPGFIKPDTDTHVYFYEQDFYVLSNFSAFNLRWKGFEYPTSEHAYHAEKFRNHRGDVADLIACAPSAHEAYKLAEHWKGARRTNWDDAKVDIMRSILREKAHQHEYVRRKLLATGDRILVEDSWRDDFWGWGPNRDGQNMLGKLWMEVRAELHAQQEGK